MMGDHRKVFFDVWTKYLQKQPLSDFEKDVLAVLLKYPEYTQNISRYEIAAPGGENPYFILGSHIAMNDQVKTDSPKGIQALYYLACRKHGVEKAELMILTVMRSLLGQSYANCEAPSDEEYLTLVKNIC